MTTTPLKPNEAHAAYNRWCEAEVPKYIQKVNDVLTSKFDGNNTVPVGFAVFGINERIRAAVAEAFRKAGWKVRQFGDDKSGGYCELSRSNES